MLATSTARQRVDADEDGHHHLRSVHDRKDRWAGGMAMSFLQFHGNSLNIKHVLDEDEKLCRHRVTKGRTHCGLYSSAHMSQIEPGPSMNMRVRTQKPLPGLLVEGVFKLAE